MRTVILVPRRMDYGHRDNLWVWCRRRWESLHPGWPIYEGHHDGEGAFNRSLAINRAAALAGEFDVALVIDADVFLDPDQVNDAVANAWRTGKVTWAHFEWRGWSEEATARLLRPDDEWERHVFGTSFLEWDGGARARHAAVRDVLRAVGMRDLIEAMDPETVPNRIADDILEALDAVSSDHLDEVVEVANPLSWSCCIAIRRDAWDAIGGFDERFVGWGWEDQAFAASAIALVGHERIPGPVYHLWHERTPGAGKAGLSGGRLTLEAVRNAQLGLRYQLALRRDYGRTDRDPVPPGTVEKDIVNLRTEDARVVGLAPRGSASLTQDYWPSIDELVAQSKHHQAAARYRERVAGRSVTIAVHTDGRREYIAQAIASLDAMVTGPIVRRIIFDDSGDTTYKAWCNEQFGPLGFYVVGPERRLGYTGSMRALWSYLQRKADSEFVFLAEDDFTYDEPIDLEPMIDTLLDEPHLRQLALLRHAFYAPEVAAGGIREQDPDAYVRLVVAGHTWQEHREHFTANPSLFRRSLTAIEWPDVPKGSERVYTDILNRDPDSRFGYWGDTEVVTHIGKERKGTGY